MSVLGASALLVRTRVPPVVLCYHGLGPAPAAGDPNGLMVEDDVFAAQLDWLLEAGYRLVDAAELWRTVERDGPLAAAGMAAVTFDDGLRTTLATAERLLAERGGRGTAFLLPALLGERHPHLPELELVDADDVRALAGGPLELGAHGLGHDDLTQLDYDGVVREARGSRRLLERLANRDIPGFAYPFGRFTPETVRAVRDAGVAYACACSGAGPWERLAVPREPVFPTTSARQLQLKARGLHPPVSRLAGLARRVVRR